MTTPGAGGLGAEPPVVRTRTSMTRRLTWCAGGLLLLGVVGIAGPAAWTHARASGRLYTAADVASVPPTDVTMVLGAGVDADGRPSLFLKARLDLAVDLYRRGLTRVILVSGANPSPDYDEPTTMRDYLVAQGVPVERVVADFAGLDTYDSCARARRIFGVERLLVVSQTYHLPRALTICRELGLDAIGVGDDSARRYAPVWREGELREYGANVKAVWDVASRRDPILGPPESAVHDALTAHANREDGSTWP